VVHLSGKRALEHLSEVCRAGAWVVLDTAAPKGFAGDCTLFDSRKMAQSGAVSFAADGQMRSVRAEAGRRLWTDPPRLGWAKTEPPQAEPPQAEGPKNEPPRG
jgi:competence protein ComEC